MEETEEIRVTILQGDIAWEDKQENLHRLHDRLEALQGTTDVVVVPETFSTGFSMNAAALAETNDGETLDTLRRWAAEYGVALAGSYVARDETPGTDACYNRAFFLTPEGESHYVDKRHLFRMGGEATHFTAGTERKIIRYRGWNILLLVCYDLRFPVWSRNRGNEYDLLIYVANWPASRRRVWDVLLQARALENQSYVCAANRIGTDGNALPHNGGSTVYSYKGEVMAQVPDNTPGAATALLSRQAQNRFRKKFPCWKDADIYTLHE